MASGNTLAVFLPHNANFLNNIPPNPPELPFSPAHGPTYWGFRHILSLDQDVGFSFDGVLPKQYSGGGIQIIVWWGMFNKLSAFGGGNDTEIRIRTGFVRLAEDIIDIDSISNSINSMPMENKLHLLPRHDSSRGSFVLNINQLLNKTNLTLLDGGETGTLVAGDMFRLFIHRDQSIVTPPLNPANAWIAAIELRES